MESDERPREGEGPEAMLVAALCRARKKFGQIKKDASYDLKPGVTIHYAPLESVLEAVGEALAEEGLYVTGTLEQHEHGLTQRMTLRHSGGGELHSIVPVLFSDRAPNPMQAMGGAITYSRRYALLSLLNLAAEDDDAQSAGGGGQREEARGQQQQQRNGDGRNRAQGNRPSADRRESPAAQARREVREWPKGYPRAFDDYVRAAVTKWNDAWKEECRDHGMADGWTEDDNLTSTHRMGNDLATLAIEQGLLAEGAVSVINPEGELVRERKRTWEELRKLYASDPRAFSPLAIAYRDRRFGEAREACGFADTQLQEAAG